ncbi:exodeoxyribonuclease V subunit alpha [Leptospira gomenensis]|uniref:RecBCD enzyme subunit RecD n=1 Tax=Leptospira gomenensis TaxID=2484974 RepID=A0A5F1YY33_9LEPT|nr:AAA family ATPase [Leptospira gomenensis]TGK29431.1 exodeoxyribonuclease V subunit alpha [Leptospira gomenensis]TGK33666.1 exodeoxyribonuclease V subunit alpha [Leptospira gomenensis]TGK44907.1 exodeoxyribonuclease V subunit alpha [Leptospira gomenensis]TGK64528.1 exodeoxyribonuclease V subunit alpha [Leptospira gomenensis]
MNDERYSPFAEKLKEDLLGLISDRKRGKSAENLKEFEPVLLEMLNELLNTGREGGLCVRVKPEWKEFLKTKPPGLIVSKFEGEEWAYFEKTYRNKTELENLLRNEIRDTPSFQIDLENANAILADLQSASFTLKKGQIEAVLSCLASPFRIISGGPGTGKTTVIAFILEILKRLDQLPSHEEIALVAPTGRAAQRLTESLLENLAKLSDSKTYSFLRGGTVHGLLSYKQRLGDFYYGKDRRLPHRLIVVDEVSMIDLDLMVSLFRALPEKRISDSGLPFRLILIGDPNQLPSVEKGAVLSDFLNAFDSFKGSFVSKLEESNRQKPGADGKPSKIVSLAEEILEYSNDNLNLGARIDETFPRTDRIGDDVAYQSEVVWLRGSSSKRPDFSSRDEVIELLWKDMFYPQIRRISSWRIDEETLNDDSFYETFLKEIGGFRCLTLYRKGPRGVETIQNKLMGLAARDLFGKRELGDVRIQSIRLAQGLYFSGLPILISQNDPSRKLFNGDVGIVLKTHTTAELRAVFPIDRRLFPFALDTLPKHEPAFVTTIHKSQGSEYDTILIYLPESLSSEDEKTKDRLLNRNILYTGITRAKKQVILAGDPESWQLGIETRKERNTGFRI